MSSWWLPASSEGRHPRCVSQWLGLRLRLLCQSGMSVFFASGMSCVGKMIVKYVKFGIPGRLKNCMSSWCWTGMLRGEMFSKWQVAKDMLYYRVDSLRGHSPNLNGVNFWHSGRPGSSCQRIQMVAEKDRWNMHDYRIMFARWKRDIHTAWKWYMHWNTRPLKYAKLIFFFTKHMQWERYTNNMKLDKRESLLSFELFVGCFWSVQVDCFGVKQQHYQCTPLLWNGTIFASQSAVVSLNLAPGIFQASEMEEMAAPLGLQNGSASCVSTSHDLYLKTKQLKVMCSCSSSKIRFEYIMSYLYT